VTSDNVRARRGDLVVVEYSSEQPGSIPTYEIERITSVARDGQVMATERVHYYNFEGWEGRGEEVSTSAEPLFRIKTSRVRQHRAYRCHWVRHYLVGELADPDGTWADLQGVALRRASWRALRFGDLDTVRDVLRPYLKAAAATSAPENAGRVESWA
jgi:hypothetical protein